MKSFLLLILSCRVVSYAFPIPPEVEKVAEEMKLAEKYLNSSYPQPEPRSEDKHITTGEIRQFCGTEVTNKLYPNSPAVMKRPRWEVPKIGTFAHFPGSIKWPRRNLTYSFQNYTPHLKTSVIKKTAADAFLLWSKVAPLTFTEVLKDGDIKITFYSKDYRTPFNESVIGYAYGPGKGLGGDVFMNGQIHWTMDHEKTFEQTGTNLCLAFCHEFGHALGLAHSSIHGSVMYANYIPQDYIFPNFADCLTLRLHDDDIAGIQALYGTKSNSIALSNHTSTAGAVPKVAGQ